MHEAGIIAEMLRTAERAAADAGCSTIQRIVLRVGALSSAVPEALDFAFEALKVGTSAAGARLDIERVEAAAFCERCQREFLVEDVLPVCPRCGEATAVLRRGQELDLMRIQAV